METLIKIVEVALTAIGAIAPSVVAAFTGGQSTEDAIKAAREALAKIPDRTDQADADLAARLGRG